METPPKREDHLGQTFMKSYMSNNAKLSATQKDVVLLNHPQQQ